MWHPSLEPDSRHKVAGCAAPLAGQLRSRRSSGNALGTFLHQPCPCKAILDTRHAAYFDLEKLFSTRKRSRVKLDLDRGFRAWGGCICFRELVACLSNGSWSHRIYPGSLTGLVYLLCLPRCIHMQDLYYLFFTPLLF